MNNTVERCAGMFGYNFSSNSNKNEVEKLSNLQLSRAVEHIIKLTGEWIFISVMEHLSRDQLSAQSSGEKFGKFSSSIFLLKGFYELLRMEDSNIFDTQ